jgi:hypothetical protein
MPTPTPIATLSLLPPVPPMPGPAEVVVVPNGAEVVVVARVVDGNDMAKGVGVDEERDVGDVVDEGNMEVEADESLMLK